MELARFTSRGGLSVRSIFVFVVAVIMTALLCTVLSGAKTNAQGPVGFWKGDTITYDTRQYYPMGAAESGQSHNLPVGVEYYLAVEEISQQPLERKAHIIYFAPGTDPPTETSATYLNYDYSIDEEFSNPAGRTTIEMTPAGEEGTQTASSCTVEGIGWIICPVSVWLAEAMDNLYAMISDLVVVPPIQVNNTNTPLYTAWNVMRSFANIAFIIVFLIIIFSQVTSVGVGNYGLKKLTPRLIVAAVLVNVSFFVCALAVDLSNLAGYGLQQILINIREETFAIAGDTWSENATNTWSSMTAFILSGGTAAAGWIGISIATGGSIAAAVYLLVPILIGLAVAVFVALLILAARQAIIVILIVVAPLAFVANLLPNTEKWFERWKDLFMTMLIFFPAFSLVFGGSQLAGGIIIQNANNILMMIFGLAVQVAPLVITPLLIKLSGGLLGRIAGLVNDPARGALDKTKGWASDRADYRRAKSLADDKQRRWFNPNRYNAARGTARFFDARRRNVKKGTEVYEKMAETRYMDRNKRFGKLSDLEHEADIDRRITDGAREVRQERHVRTSPALLRKEMTARTLTNEVNSQKEQLNRISTALESGQDISATGNLGGTSRADNLMVRNQVAARDIALSAIAVQSGKRVQQNQLSDALLKNTVTIDGQKLRDWAGGLDPDNGAESALTYAVNLKREAENKLIGERTQLIKHFKLNGSQRQSLAMGNNVLARDSSGIEYTFLGADEYAHDAAIEMQMKTGSFGDIIEIIKSSGNTNRDYRTTISDAIPANGLPGKALFLGGRFIDEVGKGTVSGDNGILHWAAQSILGGKIKAEDLANNDADAIKIYLEAARRGAEFVDPADMPAFLRYRAQLQETARTIMDPDTDLDRNATQAAKDALVALRDERF